MQHHHLTDPLRSMHGMGHGVFGDKTTRDVPMVTGEAECAVRTWLRMDEMKRTIQRVSERGPRLQAVGRGRRPYWQAQVVMEAIHT